MRTLWWSSLSLILLLGCCSTRANRVYVHPFTLFAAENISCETQQNQMSRPLEALPVEALDIQALIPDPRNASKVNPQNITERTAVLSGLLNPLGLRMYVALSKKQSGTNSLFSPVNTCGSLFSLYLGASKETASYYLHLLGLSDPDRKECLSIVDGHKVLGALQNIRSLVDDGHEKITSQVWAFAQQGARLSREFIQGTQDFSDSSYIRGVDFSKPQEAETLVNGFVDKTSEGNLKSVFNGLSPNTNLLFLSSFNFQAKWETAFEPEKSNLQEFHLNATTTVMTPMMSRTGAFQYFNDKSRRCTVLKMPLSKQAFMLLVLPHEGVELSDIETETSLHTVFSSWHQNVQEGLLELSLPKFSSSSVNDLNDLLSNMDPKIETKMLGSEAEFSQLSDITPFNIDKAINMVQFNMSEDGAEAVGKTNQASVAVKLSFNRPFFFSVVEGYYNTILLLGKMANPLL